MMEQTYIGNELDLFSYATNWKNYWSDLILPYLGNSVLEVGAGLGGTTQILMQKTNAKNWVCIEPDPRLAAIIEKNISNGRLKGNCQIHIGTLETLAINGYFDSILYIDVIEHIEYEKEELLKAISYLNKGGYLIIIVPAHNFLYSEFDKAIGHFRRYNRKMLLSVIPSDIEIVKCMYLDSIGIMASLANKLLLNQKCPTIKQIQFWDKNIVPISKLIDKMTLNSIGKSILFIGRKT